MVSWFFCFFVAKSEGFRGKDEYEKFSSRLHRLFGGVGMCIDDFVCCANDVSQREHISGIRNGRYIGFWACMCIRSSALWRRDLPPRQHVFCTFFFFFSFLWIWYGFFASCGMRAGCKLFDLGILNSVGAQAGWGIIRMVLFDFGFIYFLRRHYKPLLYSTGGEGCARWDKSFLQDREIVNAHGYSDTVGTLIGCGIYVLAVASRLPSAGLCRCAWSLSFDLYRYIYI
jgi:hypothetical protein